MLTLIISETQKIALIFYNPNGSWLIDINNNIEVLNTHLKTAEPSNILMTSAMFASFSYSMFQDNCRKSINCYDIAHKDVNFGVRCP